MNDDHYLPQGITFARKAAALLASDNRRNAIAFAGERWGTNSAVVQELRAAVAGGETTENSSAMEVDSSTVEFLDIVRGLSILGRLQSLRRVPPDTPVAFLSRTATAYWVGQSKAIPLSHQAFTRSTLGALKVAALAVFSNELVKAATDRGVRRMRDDLIEAAVRLLDLSLIDPTYTGTPGVSPASITSGIVGLTSTGDLADDAAAAIAAFSGSLLTASWVMSPRLAAQAGLRAGGRGAAADLGAKGGTLAGLPVLTSEAVPLTSDGGMLALIDAAGIVVVEDGLELQRSNEAVVEMSNTPAGASDTPTATSTVLMPMFSTESTAAKMTFRTNWARARPGSVVIVENASYSAP